MNTQDLLTGRELELLIKATTYQVPGFTVDEIAVVRAKLQKRIEAGE